MNKIKLLLLTFTVDNEQFDYEIENNQKKKYKKMFYFVLMTHL